MNRYHLLFCCLLILRTSYAVPDAAPGTTFLSSSSSFPTTGSTTPPSPPESTPDAESLLPPEPATTSPPGPSRPQQNQTQPAVSTKQTQRPRLSQKKTGHGTFRFPAHIRREDSDARQQQVAAASGMEIMLMEPKDRLPMGISQGAGIHAMGLFLGGCALLLCLFVGIYCIYTCGAKKEPFSHHRLYNEGFDDPALFLDNPKDYDWFFYETDGYVYPTPCQGQSQTKPIQTLSVPALKQPPPVLEMSPEKLETAEAAPDTKPPLPKLECLSPANLNTGNFV